MPKLTSYIESEVDVDIEVDEFIDSCSPKEISKIVKILSEDGYIPTSAIKPKNYNVLDEMWWEKIDKLRNSRLSMTDEEIEIIEKIAGRF